MELIDCQYSEQTFWLREARRRLTRSQHWETKDFSLVDLVRKVWFIVIYFGRSITFVQGQSTNLSSLFDEALRMLLILGFIYSDDSVRGNLQSSNGYRVLRDFLLFFCFHE